jgi:hypothetical protein
MAAWVADLGYVGVQMPTGGADSFFDLALAAESQAYCDDIAGTLAGHGLQITELSTHLQGQLVAVHPAYDELFDGFAPPELRGKPAERQVWAVGQVKAAAVASRRLGLNAHATFSGAWPGPTSIPGRSARRAWSRRLSPSLAAAGSRSWTPSKRGRRRLLRDPSGRGPARRRDLRAVPGRGRRPRARQHPVRSQPLRAAAAGLPRLHRPLSRAHQSLPREGRRVPPVGPSPASTAAIRAGSSGRAASGRWATARSTSRRSSPSWPSTTIPAGRCWSGSAR